VIQADPARFNVDELNSRATRENESARRLRTVTAIMRQGGVGPCLVCANNFIYLTGVQIKSFPEIRLASIGSVATPD